MLDIKKGDRIKTINGDTFECYNATARQFHMVKVGKCGKVLSWKNAANLFNPKRSQLETAFQYGRAEKV